MLVTNIQRFCMHDGPGVRTVLFLKGCPLSCFWCHNPETQTDKKQLLYHDKKCILCGGCSVCENDAHVFSKLHTLNRDLCKVCGKCASVCPTNALEICGEEHTVESVFEIIEKDKAFYLDNGGVTISGGEPFMQSDQVIELLLKCKENSINTAVETCGYFKSDILKKAVSVTDIVLWDIKDTNAKRHKQNTGVDNELILKNLFLADSLGAKILLRCILLNGVNTNDEHYQNIADIARKLKNLQGVEFLPYHTFGDAKQTALGYASNADKAYIPTKAQMDYAKEYLVKQKIKVI